MTGTALAAVAGPVADPQPAAEDQPQRRHRDRDGEPDQQAAERRPGVADRGRHGRPRDARPQGGPERIRERQRRRRSALLGARRLAQDDQRQRRVGKAHPQAGQAHRGDRQPGRELGIQDDEERREAGDEDGDPGLHESLGRVARREARLDPRTGGPGERRGGQADPGRGRAQPAPFDQGQGDVGVDGEEREGDDAADQDRGRHPACGAQRPRWRQPAEGQDRHDSPDRPQHDQQHRITAGQTSEQQPRTGGNEERQREPFAQRRGGRGRRPRPDAPHLRVGDPGRDRDEREQAKEHPAPPDGLADRAGDGRPQETGQHPRRRERREHLRPEPLREGCGRSRRTRSAGPCRPRAPAGTARRRAPPSTARGRRRSSRPRTARCRPRRAGPVRADR